MKKIMLFLVIGFTAHLNIQAQSLVDFPWLEDILDQENCCFNEAASLYENGNAEYIYVSKNDVCAGGGGILYNSEGVMWCRDRGDLDCRSFYAVSFKNELYNCSQNSEFDFFSTYPWLSSIIDLSNCCNNQNISVYRNVNNHEYICISGDPTCNTTNDRWYYENGDLFCIGSQNNNCSEVYGFTEMDIIAEWDCSGNDSNGSTNFTVSIENIMEARAYFASGTTGLILPDESETISFNAGIGHYLSFATMFVQSNDLFIGPDQNGLALYAEDGAAKTGDITEYIRLWDAGTEVNEEPGMGPNQAPRQSGPNTGTIENGVVQLVNDAFVYPPTNESVEITLTHDGGTGFSMTIKNVSATSAVPTPFAPGVWTIHSANQAPLFVDGSPASIGLENIAEDGDNSILDTEISDNSGLVSPFAPGTFAINNPVFMSGQPSSSALEALAEDGNPGGFVNVFAVPVNASGPGPLFPGDAYSFSFTATDGDALSFATMFVQSNDWFIGSNSILLFESGNAITGDITQLVQLYDAGSEVDEYAGAGLHQAPRQSGANSGPDESGLVEVENDAGSHVPTVSNMVRVTISHN